MKVIELIENNPITGARYGLVEVPDNMTEINHHIANNEMRRALTRYKKVNHIKAHLYSRTRNK